MLLFFASAMKWPKGIKSLPLYVCVCSRIVYGPYRKNFKYLDMYVWANSVDS